MNYRLREYLIDLCTKSKMISYQELSNECKLGLDMASPGDRAKIAGLLGEISTYEHHNKRPFLTAIVVAKGTTTQGDGFFKLGEQLGKGNWKILKRNAFDAEQIKLCFEFWSNKENYNKFRNIEYE
jgi:hypothetical protein